MYLHGLHLKNGIEDMYCHRCGKTIDSTGGFCAHCGQDLGTTPMPAVGPTTPMHAVGPTTPMAAAEKPVRKTDLEVVREALGDSYDVREEIGRGGMATVFRAQEQDLKRDVAIKVLPFSHVHDANFVERFANEARTAAALEHPNIIPIYRVGRSSNVIYLAMRYLSGPSLAELIEDLAPMEPKDIRRILVQCASALGHAHAHGVVHRDIKPDNIMFKESGEVVVCDFGIAKAASGTALTGTGMAVGTPLYMSPEQVRAQPLDGRSDLYSLGVVAYQCLTGRVPFDGDDAFAIGFKHINEAPPAPDARTPDHESIFQIIQQMMAKDPEERFPNAEALVEALAGNEAPSLSAAVTRQIASGPQRPVLAPYRGRPTSKRPPTTPTTPMPTAQAQPVTAAPKKKRRTGALVAMLFVLGAGGAGGGGYFYVEQAGGVEPVLTRYPSLRPWVQKVADAVAAYLPTTPVPEPVLEPAVDSAAVPETAPPDTIPVDPVPEAPSSGHLVLSNVPRDATVWVDERFVTDHRREVTPGTHQVRIAAPGFAPYTARVTVPAGETVTHRVALVAAAQCEKPDDPGYNLGEACFEVSPRLPAGASAAVPLRTPLPAQPSKPVVLAIEVTADGRAGQILVKDPSDVPEFALRAVEYARTITYVPATKNGRSVVAWLRMPLYAPR